MCCFFFFSGLMALLLSRSKPRTARPPASQACYEKPPNYLLSDHCSRDLRGFHRSQSSGLHFICFTCFLIVCYHIFFFFNCCKTITTVVHVFHALIAWSLTEHTGRAGLLIRVVKETQRCIKGPLCLKYREAFSTFACFLFFFHLLERQEGR